MGRHAFGPPRAPIAAQPLALAARRGSDNYDTWLSLTRSASASSPPHRRSGRGRGRREFGCPQPPAKDWLVGACGQTCESSPPAFAPPAACMHIAASRQHAQPRSRRLCPWDIPCEGGHATAASFAPRPTGQTSDASRETLPVAVAVRCVSRRARVSVDAFALGRPRPLLHRSPRPAQVRAQLRATRSARPQPPPRGRDLPGV